MITIKSNIKEFLNNYRKITENFKVVLNNIATKLAEKIVQDMKTEIETNRFQWAEKGSLEYISNIDFLITPTSNKSVMVSIGDNLKKHIMSDGTLVNPVFFIEFGFGIVGQNNPSKNHELFDWEYNINNHTDAWWYMGFDGQFYQTKGSKGINFLYKTLHRKKNVWVNYLKELLKENANV